ncbi:histidine-rich glycoprotein-like [Nerophis ophidion]|uniref:histidine-rich glycoprotein-like n=1 Tax=Nerophis ophidion TaxID=159077 RepID=UPI002ADFD050|nr:histidine-rich glycoprotein-like [Nerophis ophidion]
MKNGLLFSLLLALGCVHIQTAPVDQGAMVAESCEDALAVGAAKEALTKINQDRKEGYVFGLHRLSNAHSAKHGETGFVFYLTLDVVETNCSVLSKKDWKDCEARNTHDTPVYGQCKAAIYMNRVHRVVRLYKYNCVIRPVPAARVNAICPDCSSHINFDHAEVQETVNKSLEKFNKESGLTNTFSLLKIARATSGMAMGMYYHVEYSIQETTCTKNSDGTDDKCPPMQCEFAHKGFCKASHFHTDTGDSNFSVQCEIYEPEAAEREKKLHLLGGETDHRHNDTHPHSHDPDQAHAADDAHTHDHVHDHTKPHAHHDKTGKHAEDSEHHHTHDHAGDSAHRHAHDHSHDHGHGHDHVHAHHAHAHNHTGDSANHHHDYKHEDGAHTHEHDHELSLDHDHKHAHLHGHEHHHHHHQHDHETTVHDHPEGLVRVLAAMDQPTTMPSFPETPAGEAGVVLPLIPDPQIPGEMQPTIQAFPASVSSQCSAPMMPKNLVEEIFAEDPLFKAAA